MHVEAALLPGSGPQTASRFQGWRVTHSLTHSLTHPSHQGWRLPLPPAGLPAGLTEPATGLLAGLLRGFCTLNGLALEKLVPLPSATAR